MVAAGIIAIVDKLLGIGEKLAERGVIKAQREPIERLRKVKLDLLEEQNKGPLMSTVKLGLLYSQLEIEMDAYLATWNLENQ